MDVLVALALLGLVWALISCGVLTWRLRTVERTLLQERAETAARLEALESLARDRWLAEAVTLGGQVSAMIAALEEAARQSTAEIDERRVALATLLEQVDARLTDLRAAPPAAARRAPARRTPPSSAGAVTAPPTSRQQMVHRLAAEGLAPAEIARRAGMGQAEVDLILRLAPPPLQHSA